MTTAAPRRHRRLFQFSLRTFLIAVTLLAVWLGLRAIAAKQQRAALNRIAALGGSVRFNYQHDDSGSFDADAKPLGPRWLRALVGDEYFDRVVYVGLQHTEVTDADLRVIACLKEVETFWLVGTSVSDEGLEHLAQLRQLRHLYLADTRVGDEGLHYLRSLKNLEGLTLSDTRITNRGLAHLRQLHQLVSINIPGTAISADGLRELHDLPRLEYLNLKRTNVSNTCLSVLDETTRAWWIDLRDTQVTDDGIMALGNVSSLRKLEITRNQANPETLEKLRQALPECQVVAY